MPHQQTSTRSTWALVLGYALSSLGDELCIITLMLRAERDTGSGWLVSGVLIAAFLPVVIAGPLLAPLADRVDRGTLIRTVSCAQAVAAAALIPFSTPGAVLALTALVATGTSVVTPAMLALVPSMFGEQEAARGYGRLEAARNVGSIAGPALAGLLLIAGDGALALAADAVSFLVIAACAPTSRDPQGTPAPGRDERWLTSVKAGAAAVGTDTALRACLISLILAVLFSTIANTALVFYSRDYLSGGAAAYGWLTTAQALGSFAMASKLLHPLLRLGHTGLLLAATVVLGGTRLFMGWLPLMAVALTACVISGACVTAQNLALRDLVRARVPAHRRGRAFASVGSTLTSANIAGTAAGGPLATVFGAVNALLISGAGTVASAGAVIPLHRSESRDSKRSKQTHAVIDTPSRRRTQLSE